jgi:hypothetical protein
MLMLDVLFNNTRGFVLEIEWIVRQSTIPADNDANVGCSFY